MLRNIIFLSLIMIFSGCDVGENSENNTNNINNTNNTNTNNNTTTNNNNNTSNTNNNTCGSIDEVMDPMRVGIITTDNVNGSLNVLDISGENWSLVNDVLAIHSDSVGNFFNSMIFIIGRLGADHITGLNGDDYTTFYQFPLGSGSNPQDIVPVSGCKSYVSLYGRDHIATIDFNNPSTTGKIDISAFSDEDELPEVSFLKRSGTDVFAAIQNLVNYSPSRNGRIVVVDTLTDEVSGSIELTGSNPFSPIVIVPDSNQAAVACAGDFSGADASIEVFTSGDASSMVVATGETLGGVPTDLAFYSSSCGFALVSTPEWTSGIRRFCTDGTMEWVVVPGTYSITGIAWTGEELLFSDNNLPGIRIYDDVSEEVLGTSYETSLPVSFTRPFFFMD
ncbi:hypothetical protein KKF34_06670 [Myxococcota bacterium]|nr:hypothetical protein [Myxococcota bacterium]MBU1381524.1 hypothetical protein [Myxococcota bacterium]MBU1496543.1 hypothetical protein [Myxococcota bacterium]